MWSAQTALVIACSAAGVAVLVAGVALVLAIRVGQLLDFETLGSRARARYEAQLCEVREIAQSVASDLDAAGVERAKAARVYAAARRAEQAAQAAEDRVNGDRRSGGDDGDDDLDADEMAKMLLS